MNGGKKQKRYRKGKKKVSCNLISRLIITGIFYPKLEIWD
jgi:hypothetical protein